MAEQPWEIELAQATLKPVSSNGSGAGSTSAMRQRDVSGEKLMALQLTPLVLRSAQMRAQSRLDVVVRLVVEACQADWETGVERKVETDMEAMVRLGRVQISRGR